MAIVWTTASRAVSITDTSLVAVFATNSVRPAAYIAAGCSPTSMPRTAAAGSARSITLTVPVVVAPVTGSAGTCVLYELIVVSPGRASRPPSLLTYSFVPIATRSRGALPTVQLRVIVPLAASSATTRFWPLTAA